MSPQLSPPTIFGLDLYTEPRLRLLSFTNFEYMDLRIEFYKAAFSHRGNGFDIPVFKGISRYQYGQGVGDVLRGILRFIPTMAQFLKPVAIKGAQTLLKSGSETIKEGATIKDVIKSTLTPTVNAVVGATVDNVASKLIQMRDNNDAASPPNPPIVVPEIVQAGSGRKRRRAPVYKKATKTIKYSSNQRQIIYNFLKWPPLEMIIRRKLPARWIYSVRSCSRTLLKMS